MRQPASERVCVWKIVDEKKKWTKVLHIPHQHHQYYGCFPKVCSTFVTPLYTGAERVLKQARKNRREKATMRANEQNEYARCTANSIHRYREWHLCCDAIAMRIAPSLSQIRSANNRTVARWDPWNRTAASKTFVHKQIATFWLYLYGFEMSLHVWMCAVVCAHHCLCPMRAMELLKN